jgi:hypothetical protein
VSPARAPLVPAGVDLRNFGFLPLDVGRLLGSTTWVLAANHPRAGHALVTLWCRSWHEVPAGSLPDDDRMLAHLAMCTPAAWRRLREHALRGWGLCSDGRLYHPVVCEKALEAWIEKLLARVGSARGNAARWNSAADEAATLAQLEQARDHLRALAPGSRYLRKGAPAPARQADEDAAPPAPAPARDERPQLRLVGEPDEKPRRTAKRLPDGWVPDAAGVEFAQRHGLTGKRLQDEADQFRDYWNARGDAQARKLDWAATWRTWVRRGATRTASRKAAAGDLSRMDYSTPL